MRTYGGLRYENGASCKATLDGGIILAGSTGSFGNGNSDMYLTKVDSDGTYQWSRSYGGFFTENCHAIIETADTGFLLVGYTNSFGAGQYDMYVVKTNSNGDTDWTKTFGGPAWDFAYDVMESVDGNYLVVGETYSTTSGNSDVYVLKLDLSGDTLWTKRYGGSKQDFGRSIIELYDSTIVIAGGTSSMGAGGLDVLLMKLTAQGDSLWARAHGGPEDDWARDVIMTRDTGLSVIGTTESFNTDYKEMYHIKTDSSGLNLEFQWNWGQINNQEGYEHFQRFNGNFMIIGYSMTSGAGGKDFMLQETDEVGLFLTGYTYGGTEDDAGYSFDRTLDGGLVLFGTTNSFGVGLDDYLLIKTDSSGFDYQGNPIVSTFLETYEDTSIPDAPLYISQVVTQDGLVSVYPIPMSSQAQFDLASIANECSNMTLLVFNNIGQAVFQKELNSESFTFSRSGLPDGLYSYLIVCDDNDSLKRYSGKLVIISK
jgi:hypothetical protein